MAAPEYVPTTKEQQPRRGLGLPPPHAWVPARPGELDAEQPEGRTFGRQGPDQGYALLLANRFRSQLVLDGTAEDDAITGCLGVGLRRASLFGRAPIIHDLDIAFRIWGFLGGAPTELIALRKPLFEAASHHYWDQRAIADHVPEATLRMSHQQVASMYPAQWRQLIGAA